MVLAVECGRRHLQLISSGRISHILYVVSDGTATDIDSDISTVEIRDGIASVIHIIGTHHTIGLLVTYRLVHQIQTVAYGTQTASTIDRTQHGTTLDVDFNAAAHITCRERLTTEATTTTEYVTIDVAGAPGTYIGIVLDSHRDVLHHVAILTATKYRTVDSTTRDFHFHLLHVRGLVEEDTLVALTGSKEVAGQGVSGNLSQGTWYTERTTRHLYRTLTTRLRDVVEHIGRLIGEVSHLPNATGTYVRQLVTTIN